MTRPTLEQFRRIELLVLDVDGVLTDGRVTYTATGDEIKSFHVRDGSGLKYWRESGKRIAILSGRTSPAVVRRAAELGIEIVVQGASDKLPALRRILADAGLEPDQACAIGDDLPDLPVLRHCGMGIAVADAVAELQAVANYVTKTPGGLGAVREAIEWLMVGQGNWASVIESLSV